MGGHFPALRNQASAYHVVTLCAVGLTGRAMSQRVLGPMEPPPVVDPNKNFACPECGGMMWVVWAEPEKMGFERRSYECSVCLHTETVMVAVSTNRR